MSVKKFFSYISNGVNPIKGFLYYLYTTRVSIQSMVEFIWTPRCFFINTGLKQYYCTVSQYNIYIGVFALCFSAGAFAFISALLWCAIMWVIVGNFGFFMDGIVSPLDLLNTTLSRYADMYRVGWLAFQDFQSRCGDGLDNVPLVLFYYAAFKKALYFYPVLTLVLNLLFTAYVVLSLHCFVVMLYGLILKKPTVSVRLSIAQLITRALCLAVIILVILCPPVFGGPDIPTSFPAGQFSLEQLQNNPWFFNWSISDRLYYRLICIFITFCTTAQIFFTYVVIAPLLWRSLVGIITAAYYIVFPKTHEHYQKRKRFLNFCAVVGLILVIVAIYTYWADPGLFNDVVNFIKVKLQNSLVVKVIIRVYNVITRWFSYIPRSAECSGDDSEKDRSWISFFRGKQKHTPSPPSGQPPRAVDPKKILDAARACGDVYHDQVQEILDGQYSPRTKDARLKGANNKYEGCLMMRRHFDDLMGHVWDTSRRHNVLLLRRTNTK